MLPRRLQLALLAFLLAGTATAAGADGAAPAPVKKALLIGIDGLRGDALLAADAPRLHGLMEAGCWTDSAQASSATRSGPGWSTVLTGVWPEKHRVFDNDFEGARFDRFPHGIVRLMELAPGARGASIVRWNAINERMLRPYLASPDPELVRRESSDELVAAAACAVLATRDVDFMFVCLTETDHVGHDYGFHPGVPRYMRAITATDALVGQVLDALRARESFEREDWLIVVVSDHGGTLDGEHGRDRTAHRTVPLIISGASTARGRLHRTANQVDVLPTIFAHLGRVPDPRWGWDGRAIGAPLATALGENLIHNGDAEASTGASRAGSNHGVAGWRDLGSMTVVRYGASEGFPEEDGPGPTVRGRNLFCGGNSKRATMTQTIDVADVAAEIDAGRLEYRLSAFLGGSRRQRDFATLTATFVDEYGGRRGRVQLGPVTLEERRAELGGKGRTGLLERAAGGGVPPATRRIVVRLTCEAAEGRNDAFADELALVLTRSATYSPAGSAAEQVPAQ